jgi:hypothetical protein
MNQNTDQLLATCYALFRQDGSLKKSMDAIAVSEGVASKAVIERALTEYAMRRSDFPRVLAFDVASTLTDALKGWIEDTDYVSSYVLRSRGEEEPRPDDTQESLLAESMSLTETGMRLAIRNLRSMLELHLRKSFK